MKDYLKWLNFRLQILQRLPERGTWWSGRLRVASELAFRVCRSGVCSVMFKDVSELLGVQTMSSSGFPWKVIRNTSCASENSLATTNLTQAFPNSVVMNHEEYPFIWTIYYTHNYAQQIILVQIQLTEWNENKLNNQSSVTLMSKRQHLNNITLGTILFHSCTFPKLPFSRSFLLLLLLLFLQL